MAWVEVDAEHFEVGDFLMRRQNIITVDNFIKLRKVDISEITK